MGGSLELVTAKDLVEIHNKLDSKLLTGKMDIDAINWFLDLSTADRENIINSHIAENQKTIFEKKETVSTIPTGIIYSFSNRGRLLHMKKDGGPFDIVDDILRTIFKKNELADSQPITATQYECSSTQLHTAVIKKAKIATLFREYVFEAAVLLAVHIAKNTSAEGCYEAIIHIANENENEKNVYRYIHVERGFSGKIGIYLRRVLPNKKISVESKILLVF